MAQPNEPNALPDGEDALRCGWANAMGRVEDLDDQATLLDETEASWVTDDDLEAILALAGVER